jgi:lipopolysaccharide/colanic/teichoic acid biosynthesis glycosyltransferase
MIKRLFDITAALVAIIVFFPVLLFAYAAVKLASSGPAIYRAHRVGRFGHVFVMHKFRTMHTGADAGSAITGARDSRVFLVGRILRILKIDELPQLYDILIGKMSIVGPRPEDPKIVARYYSRLSRETLNVAPGLSSPGSIHYYTHSHLQLDDNDPEQSYAANLLPIKLALDLVYIRRASLWYDLTIILKTAATILLIGLGKRQFAEPPELMEAQRLIDNADQPLVTLNARQGLS